MADRVVGEVAPPSRRCSGHAVIISGTVQVACPTCGLEAKVTITQSINTREKPDLKARLLAGELNVLACTRCGNTTPLETNLTYYDPDRTLFIVTTPGDEAVGERALAAIGDTGTRRLVPSRNALLEKVKIAEAGLDNRVVEVLKVLLLASRGDDINAVLLFEQVDRAASTLHWLLLDDAQRLASPLAAYDKLAATLKPSEDLRIDRAWAVEAARVMMSSAN